MRSFTRIARFPILVLAAVLSQSIAVSSSDMAFSRHNPRAEARFDAMPLVVLSARGQALGGIALTRP